MFVILASASHLAQSPSPTTKASRNFRTNHSVGSRLRQPKELSRNLKACKKFRYLAHKKRYSKW